jgi:hypothetical protein
MPNFKKSKGYKMKGFSGFGNSPAKVSDSEVREAVQGVNKVQLKFRQPGWAKGLSSAWESFSGGDMSKTKKKEKSDDVKGVEVKDIDTNIDDDLIAV